MKYPLQALGQVVREHREAFEPRLTQNELGSRAGYGTGAGVSISRVETGLTRPSPERLAGIACALGLTPGQLEAEAAERTRLLNTSPQDSRGDEASDERLRARVKRLQQGVERREALISRLVDDFNHCHDLARDHFFMPFVETASRISGVPQPDGGELLDDEPSASDEAEFRLRFNTYGIAKALGSGAASAAAGAAVGGAVGTATAYGAFMAAVSWGTASTGVAISGLSGTAATNAALALLGGGSLAAGGAGVAGGATLLTGLVVAPAALLAVGGLYWAARRSRRQRQELLEKLDEVDRELKATQRGIEALQDVLSRATRTLEYVSVYASHARERWSAQLPPGERWEALTGQDRRRYDEFVQICAAQLAVATLDVQRLLELRGEAQEDLITLCDEVLTKSDSLVRELV